MLLVDKYDGSDCGLRGMLLLGGRPSGSLRKTSYSGTFYSAWHRYRHQCRFIWNPRSAQVRVYFWSLDPPKQKLIYDLIA